MDVWSSLGIEWGSKKVKDPIENKPTFCGRSASREVYASITPWTDKNPQSSTVLEAVRNITYRRKKTERTNIEILAVERELAFHREI